MPRRKPATLRAELPDGSRIERNSRPDGEGGREPYGSWYWLVYDPDRRPARKRLNLRTKDQGAAMRKALEHSERYRTGAFDPWSDAAPEVASVTAASAAYLDRQRRAGRAPRTIDTAKRMLDAFARSLPPGIAARHVERQNIEAFVDAPKPHREGETPKPKSPATRRRYLAVLRHFFRYCVTAGYAQTDPTSGIEAGAARPNRRDHLAEHEEAALVRTIRAAEVAEGRSYQWILDWLAFGIHTGLRPGEQARLYWSAVRLREGFIEVGRGHRVKTRGSVRPVELSPTAEAVLRRLDSQRTNEADGPVFTMPGGGPVEVGFLTKRLKKLAERAGIEKNIVAYSLRHTFGTRALLAGGNPAAVAGTLGTSLQMVQDHYGHYERRAGRGLVGRVFGGAPLEGYGLPSSPVVRGERVEVGSDAA